MSTEQSGTVGGWMESGRRHNFEYSSSRCFYIG